MAQFYLLIDLKCRGDNETKWKKLLNGAFRRPDMCGFGSFGADRKTNLCVRKMRWGYLRLRGVINEITLSGEMTRG